MTVKYLTPVELLLGVELKTVKSPEMSVDWPDAVAAFAVPRIRKNMKSVTRETAIRTSKCLH